MDSYHMERFEDYCYLPRPKRKSNEFYMNDIYFYSALLYSIFTGRCFVKDFDEAKEQELKKAMGQDPLFPWMLTLCQNNLGEQILPSMMLTIKEIVIGLLKAA